MSDFKNVTVQNVDGTYTKYDAEGQAVGGTIKPGELFLIISNSGHDLFVCETENDASVTIPTIHIRGSDMCDKVSVDG
ncbi:MAG: hypothetical protein ACPG7F_00740 [Aggregatilineales bacterium]